MIIILSCQKFWKITNSTHSPLFEDALITDLPILCGKYYIADARLPICEPLIIPYQGDCYHLTEWGHAQLWYVFDSSSCTFWLVKNTLSPPTKISYSTANTHLHTMSLNIYLVYKNTTSRFCYIHLRSPQLFSSICLLPLQHCMVLFVTSFAPTSITFKKLWT